MGPDDKDGILFNVDKNDFPGRKSLNNAITPPIVTLKGEKGSTTVVITFSIKNSSIHKQFDTKKVSSTQVFLETSGDSLKLESSIKEIVFDSLEPAGGFGAVEFKLLLKSGGGKVGGPEFLSANAQDLPE